MDAVIVAGGTVEPACSEGGGSLGLGGSYRSWLDPERETIVGADLVVAADGGADALRRLGIRPHVLVGDFDSISRQTRELLEADGVEIVELPTAKDETDTEIALRLAVDRGAADVTVLGALGGPRLDHLVGNLLLLTASWLQECRVRLRDPHHEVVVAAGDATIHGSPGDLVSLLPLTPVVEQVRTEGLAYPLRGEPLLQGATRGVSNELTGTSGRVRHGAGRLLVIRYSNTRPASARAGERGAGQEEGSDG